MADLNALIAQGAQFAAPVDPFAQYGKMQQLRVGENQNALAQYQLESAKRTDLQQNALNQAYSNAVDPATGELDYGKVGKFLAASGAGSQIPAALKQQAEFKKAQDEAAKLQSELLDVKLKQSRGFLDTLDPADPTAPARYLAWHEANHKDPIIGKALTARGVSVEQARQNIEAAIAKGPAAFATLLNQSKLGTDKFMELNKPTISTRNLGKTTKTSLISPLTGEVRDVATEANTIAPAEAERIRQEGIRLGYEGRRVAVSEQQAREAKDPVLQQRLAAARATGEAIAKGDVTAQQALPTIINRATETMQQIDQMVGKQEVRDKSGKLIQAATAPHPGFENAVGTTWLPGARFVPGTDAADFQSLFDQVKGGAFMEAFQALKGGGSITEKEGEKGTAAITRMSLATSEAEFTKAAREFQEIIRKGVQHAQQRANKNVKPVTADIDALLNKYPE
jgi:hypothetical protein